MYNSQLKTTDVVNGVKLIVASLALLIGWHSYNTAHAATGVLTQYHTVQPHPQLVQISPVKIKEKQIELGYKKAKFLSVVETTDKIHYSKNDLFCMAKNIYHEAGNQSEKGKLAVAQVTINRTRDPKFAGRVCDVVMARNQFSWTNNHRMRWTHPKGEMWNESVRVAKNALENGVRVKGMESALYYHANYVHPRWRHVERLAQIGAHIFYVRNV